MEDPVTLPAQGVEAEPRTFDRWTLNEHFRKISKTDPFSRQPLKNIDIVPNTELLNRIETWKKMNPKKYAQYKISKPRTVRIDLEEHELNVLLRDCIHKLSSFQGALKDGILNSLSYIELRRERLYIDQSKYRHATMDNEFVCLRRNYNDYKNQLNEQDDDLERFIELYERQRHSKNRQ